MRPLLLPVHVDYLHLLSPIMRSQILRQQMRGLNALCVLFVGNRELQNFQDSYFEYLDDEVIPPVLVGLDLQPGGEQIGEVFMELALLFFKHFKVIN